MAEKYFGQLDAKLTAPAASDLLAIEDSEDTKKINYDALANAILDKLTTKTYTVAGGTNTLIAAINALNSKLTPQLIQNITLSNTGAGDTGISSTDFYITHPVVTNKGDVYCRTFINAGHWYIRVLNRVDDSVATGPVNIRLLKIPV